MATHSYNPPGSLGDKNGASTSGSPPDAQAAADLIREKVSRIYAEEPDAMQELTEAEAVSKQTKHQRFMHTLSTSGKDLAAIQTEWHNYYQSLPPKEKHEVWQEFYASQSLLRDQPQITDTTAATQTLAQHKHQATDTARTTQAKTTAAKKLREARSADDLQAAIRHKVSGGGKLQAKHHLQSLLFGLGLGFVVLLIFLFGFFNEVFLAPFIQPSRNASATPLIISSSSIAPSATPEVIIPKINVEIPVDYSQTSSAESVIENALENGVVHYPTTSLPGQNGNTAIFGHSSNNIFNKGKYKFAFVLLHNLVPGDTFYLTYTNKVYAYKVITRTVVDPSNVGVLDPVPGQTATATLITCDPPGTSLRRLVVVGQQISPDPSANTATTASSLSGKPTTNLPGNGPTLGGRFIRTTVGKIIVVTVLVAVFLLTIRWINAPTRRLKR